MKIKVLCYAGQRAEETPRSIAIGEKPLQVVTVEDRWLDPNHRYFKVKCEDDGTYIIRHDEKNNRWELTSFQRQ